MIEAVENHMPEVIVIDEIGTEAEALAARTIAERGVQLIATAHGNSLDNLLMNPTLADLLGGIHSVTSAMRKRAGAERRRRCWNVKRLRPSIRWWKFATRDEFSLFADTASVVDAFLRGRNGSAGSAHSQGRRL
jgi:stage III sporulation protein SpoIIIAA